MLLRFYWRGYLVHDVRFQLDAVSLHVSFHVVEVEIGIEHFPVASDEDLTRNSAEGEEVS